MRQLTASVSQPHEKRLLSRVPSQRLLSALSNRVRRFSVAYVAGLTAVRAHRRLKAFLLHEPAWLQPWRGPILGRACPNTRRTPAGGLTDNVCGVLCRTESVQPLIDAQDGGDAPLTFPVVEKSDEDKAFILQTVGDTAGIGRAASWCCVMGSLVGASRTRGLVVSSRWRPFFSPYLHSYTRC